MRLIDKKDMSFKRGFLLDADGYTIKLNRLAEEVNELTEMKELNDFINENRIDIELSADVVVYKPTNRNQVPALRTNKTVRTPLLDKEIELAEAKALEFLNKQNVVDIDQHLARYRNLAQWFQNEDIIVADETPAPVVKFFSNILELTEQDVIETVEAWNDPEMVQLRNHVRFDFS